MGLLLLAAAALVTTATLLVAQVRQEVPVVVQVYLTVAQLYPAVLGHPDRVTQAGLQQVTPVPLMVAVAVELVLLAHLEHQLGKAETD